LGIVVAKLCDGKRGKNDDGGAAFRRMGGDVDLLAGRKENQRQEREEPSQRSGTGSLEKSIHEGPPQVR
jgi:hypothetical protein